MARALHIKASELAETMHKNLRVMQIKQTDQLTLRPLRGEMDGYYAVIRAGEPGEVQFYAQKDDILVQQSKGEQQMKTETKTALLPKYEHITNGLVVQLVKQHDQDVTLLLEGSVEKVIKADTFKRYYRPYNSPLKIEQQIKEAAPQKVRPSGKKSAVVNNAKAYRNTGYHRNENPVFDAKVADGMLTLIDNQKQPMIQVTVAPSCIVVRQVCIDKRRYFKRSQAEIVLKHIQNNQDINTCLRIAKAFDAFIPQ